MRLIYAFLFSLFFVTASAHGQGLPGYVLTLTGDTLLGTVVEQQNEQQIALYTSRSRVPQLFQARQVRGYGLRNQPAILPRVVHLASGVDSVYFVLPLQVGSASVYSYSDETGLLLLSPGADTLQELTATNWHVLVNRYLRGCATFDPSSNRILQLSFTERNVRQVLMEFNQCMNPQWRPGTSTNPRSSVWRSGLGLRMMPLYSRYRGKGDGQSANGQGYQLGLEWVNVRANGLQTTLSGSYFYLSDKTSVYRYAFPEAAYRQDINRYKLLDINVTAGKRFGRPSRPALLLGIGTGGTYNLNSETEVKQHLTNPASLQTSDVHQESGGAKIHVGFTTGTIVPIGTHHEMRMAATYQHYILSGLHIIGLQLGYTWFRK
ncbi:hypothetical protein MUN84_04065 [Hymenobacter sp. 5516J-16]|uniref:hypothetical protein n=1 Tax=Hymenobacter sp. 5516J-16 TaxID=2932253 RepID=UPI001FD304D9|nr:hypothetical protein [Hymenobacter sp. 5516J-16]UOQ77841.1 hypothetical protein MUN84_04065 [Hymenobacter sp. 5516J-16]